MQQTLEPLFFFVFQFVHLFASSCNSPQYFHCCAGRIQVCASQSVRCFCFAFLSGGKEGGGGGGGGGGIFVWVFVALVEYERKL